MVSGFSIVTVDMEEEEPVGGRQEKQCSCWMSFSASDSNLFWPWKMNNCRLKNSKHRETRPSLPRTTPPPSTFSQRPLSSTLPTTSSTPTAPPATPPRRTTRVLSRTVRRLSSSRPTGPRVTVARPLPSSVSAATPRPTMSTRLD